MRYIFATVALVAAVAAQDCQTTVPYKFETTQVNATLSAAQKRAFLERRVTTCTNAPVTVLKAGNLTDQDGSQGSILHPADKAAKNSQYQFDPQEQLQPGSLATGFCVNSNNTLSHPTYNGSPSAIFYNCHSTDSDGTIESKLYGDASLGFGPPALCSEVFLQVIECSGGVATESVHNYGGTTESVPSSTGSAISVSATSEAASATSAVEVTTGATTPTAAPAPYPVSNATTPVVSGSAAPSGSSSATTSAPATFTPGSGANVLAVGGQVLAGVAAIGAFALF